MKKEVKGRPRKILTEGVREAVEKIDIKWDEAKPADTQDKKRLKEACKRKFSKRNYFCATIMLDVSWCGVRTTPLLMVYENPIHSLIVLNILCKF